MALNFERFLQEEQGAPSGTLVYTLTQIQATAGIAEMTFTIINQGSSRETTTWKVRGSTVHQVIAPAVTV